MTGHEKQIAILNEFINQVTNPPANQPFSWFKIVLVFQEPEERDEPEIDSRIDSWHFRQGGDSWHLDSGIDMFFPQTIWLTVGILDRWIDSITDKWQLRQCDRQLK